MAGGAGRDSICQCEPAGRGPSQNAAPPLFASSAPIRYPIYCVGWLAIRLADQPRQIINYKPTAPANFNRSCSVLISPP